MALGADRRLPWGLIATADLLYTRDVAATIGARLALTERRGLEPKNLAIRRATLEDVFLDLTGRALRD